MVPRCTIKHYALGYCQNHYGEMELKGEVMYATDSFDDNTKNPNHRRCTLNHRYNKPIKICSLSYCDRHTIHGNSYCSIHMVRHRKLK